MLDPQMQAFVDQLAAVGIPPDFAAIGAEEAKASASASGAMMGAGPALRSVSDITLMGPARAIPARLYVPEAEPVALIVYFHGGGWVLGNLDGFDAPLRRLAKHSHCAILSVDYRLAPEHRFPAAFDDAYAAIIAAEAVSARLASGSSLPLVIGGDSAGANLAAAVAIAARDCGGPQLVAQLLLYPILDADFNTSSFDRYADGGLLTAAAMRWFWDQYAPDPSSRRDPRAAPLRVESLAGLPRAIVETAGWDPLRDEGEAYADRLESDGVSVQRRCWHGLTHGFFQFAQILPVAGEAVDAIADRLRETLQLIDTPRHGIAA